MSLGVSENTLSVTIPFAVYWITALSYECISSIKSPWLEKYRLHAKHDEQRFNLVRAATELYSARTSVLFATDAMRTATSAHELI